MNNNSVDYTGDEIAIISVGGRFPGAKDIDSFWKNIKDGVESVQFFTDEELEESKVDSVLYNDPNYVRAGAIIEEIDMFDAKFFGFNPREAEVFNPQHRIFLECAWEALESAGYNPEAFDGRIGVYGGEGFNTYLMNIVSNPKLMKTMNDIQLLIGNDKDFLATQVAYKLNLKGPSLTLQSGCSTSLLAISMACQGLLNFQCDIALAGGIRLGIPQKTGYIYKDGSILSPDGHCKPFDESANGTVGGSGAAIVALKRLEDAMEDGDNIYAVIKSTAVNNDGSLKIGYTAPSIDGQAEVIYEALELGGVNPETVGYVETHGTGTVLGDPIEFDALKKVFLNSTRKKGICALGSVKANIGHLDSAAGAAGVIKTALALKNKTIPPCVNYEKPNPKLNIEESPFYVPTSATEWEKTDAPRRAGVSSFGIGGTNVHAVLEEAPEIKSSPTNKKWHTMILSAKSKNALEAMTDNLESYFKSNIEANLADVAYTLQKGRKAFDYRKAIVANDINDAIEILAKTKHERIVQGSGDIKGKSTIFMFPGQGSQYLNMGLELYKSEKIFKEQIDLCSKLLEPYLGLDLRKIIYPVIGEEEKGLINQTYIAQPAIFTIEYAMAKTLMKYGIMPKAMIGHSIGEYVAACLAGVFELEDVLSLIATRGRMMQGQDSGVMTAVSAKETDIKHLLNEEVSIAAINSPSTCVISGPADKIKEIESKLEANNIGFVRLHTSHAFHSPMMNSIIEPFTAKVAKVKLNAPTLPIISNVTGTVLKDEEAKNPEYWAKHLAGTVKFSNGIEELLKEDGSVLVEVGAGTTLSTVVKHQLKSERSSCAVSTMRHPRNEASDTAVFFSSLGKLWAEGIQVNWDEMYKGEKRLRTPLPTYPFERQRYWIDINMNTVKEDMSEDKSGKKSDVSEWFYTQYWKPSILKKVKDKPISKWLIFTDEYGLGDSIAKKLVNLGNEVSIVNIGDKYSNQNENEYIINPIQADDYKNMIKDIIDKDMLPQNILHLWSVDTEEKENRANNFDVLQEKGFYSVVNIAKSLAELNVFEPIKITVVANNIQEVYEENTLSPEKITILGPCKTIPWEYINISCNSIDIMLPKTDKREDLNYISDCLINEAYAKANSYDVAYRGNKRWIESFEAIRASKDKATSYLRKNGVYLITGGLGNMGMLFAEHLTKEYKAKLALIGRSKFPSKNEWEKWIDTYGENDATSQKIIKLREMEQLGAEILVLYGDVSNEEQMKSCVTNTLETYGQLNGVIHAAGVIGVKTYNTIQEFNEEKVAEQVKSKIDGTIVLEKVLQNIDLDFCALMSSLSAVLGGIGLSTYAAVNLFMDSFAKKKNLQGNIPWISIDWDGWAFPGSMQTSEGLFIAPNEGAEALDYALSKDMMNNIVVSSGDLYERVKRRSIGNNLKLNNKTTSSQEIKLSLKDSDSELEHKIAYIWSDLLGIEEFSVNDSFFDLGGDSLLATQIIYRMRAELRIDMPIKEFFEVPTIGGIAEKFKINVDKEKKLAETLDLVMELSEEELEKLLEEE